MTTFRIILPTLVTLIFSLSFIWIIAGYVRRYVDEEYKKLVYRITRAISVAILFFHFWWLVSLLSVNETPRSIQDRTLNKEMKSNFEERMKENAKTKK